MRQDVRQEPVPHARRRLAALLAAAVLLPLAAIAAGVVAVAPREARHLALQTAGRNADAAVLALQTKCEAVGDAVTATAREAAAYATRYGSLTRVAADATADRAAARRPDSAVAVFGKDGAHPLAVAGDATGRVAAAAGGYGASCSAGRVGIAPPGVAGLSERVGVNTADDGLVGAVVVWVPLDGAALRRLRIGLGAGDITLVPRGTPSGPAAAGIVGGAAVAVRPAGPGVPYALRTQDDVHAPATGWLLLGLLALAVLSLLLVLFVTRQVGVEEAGDEEARQELERRRAELADSFERLSQVLARTHDLGGLLESVTAAALHGTGSRAALVMLAEGPAGPGVPRAAADTPGLVEYACSIEAVGAGTGTVDLTVDAAGIADQLRPFAADAYRAPHFENLVVQQLWPEQPAAGWAAVAVPLRSAGELVGVLALATPGGFDAPALERTRALAEHAGTAIANVRAHEEVRRLAVTDPLTGVGNVRHLSTTLSKEISGATRHRRQLTLLMLDLDHFKQVNDTLGHAFGDAVLREVAQRLRRCLREVDEVFRYGGEEFVIVLPETDLDGGRRVAERVLAGIADEPVQVGEQHRQVTVSVGVAAFRPGEDADQLLEAADGALYAAKREGRNRWAVAVTPEPPQPRKRRAGRDRDGEQARVQQAG